MQVQNTTQLPPEEWRPVVGWEDKFEVSSLGHVRRISSGDIMTEYPTGPDYKTGGGYRMVCFGHDKLRRIHRLVAEAFLGPCPPGHECNHIDGIKFNNRLENLEWVTPAQNGHHASVAGLMPCGERHGRVKLTEADVRTIKSLRGHVTGRELAKRFGVVEATISMILAGKRWHHI
jgi:hypothetical protein